MHRLKFRNAALGALLSCSLASGCMQYCPKGSPLISRHGYVSGMVLKRTDNGFRTEEVLISGPRKVHMICLTGRFESTKERNRIEYRGFIKYLEYLNLKNPKVIAMIENNVYIMEQGQINKKTAAGYIDGKTLFSQITRTITDSKGGIICEQKNCASHDLVFLRPEKEYEDQLQVPGETFIHEHLHDAWLTVLPEETKRSFLKVLQRVLSIGGADKDDLFRAINYLSYDARAVMAMEFVFVNYPHSPSEKQNELAYSLFWYSKFRSFFARKIHLYKKTEGHTRDKFIEREGYPIAFEYAPGFMNGFYSPVVSEEGFKKLQIEYKSPYLSSMENFEKLVPLLENFIQYLESKPREYWRELMKIKTEEDMKKYLQKKYKKHVS